MNEISQMESEDDSTLDALLMREHACTKQLLAADQVLRGVIQRDQQYYKCMELGAEFMNF